MRNLVFLKDLYYLMNLSQNLLKEEQLRISSLKEYLDCPKLKSLVD